MLGAATHYRLQNPAFRVGGLVLAGAGGMNLLIGKNNAGKSSILRALTAVQKWNQSPEFRLHPRDGAIGIGVVVPPEVWEAVRVEGTTTRQISLEDFVQAVPCYADRPLFRSGDACWFDDLVHEGGLRPGMDHLVENVAERMLPKGSSIVLVPHTRALERDGIPAMASASGAGVVATLFRSKSRPPDDPVQEHWRRVQDAVAEMADGWKLDVSIPDPSPSVSTVAAYFSRGDGSWYPYDAVGTGLHEIVILAHFCESATGDVLAIEEPELHLHPSWVRRVARYLEKVSSQKQVWLATHSMTMIDELKTSTAFEVRWDQHGISAERQGDDARESAIRDLGWRPSDRYGTDAVILVEGPTDRAWLDALLRRDPRFAQRRWLILPMWGDAMEHMETSTMRALHPAVFVVVDAERPGPSHGVRERIMRRCEDAAIPCWLLSRGCLEDYVPARIVEELFGGVRQKLGIRTARQVVAQISDEELAGTEWAALIDTLASVLGV